MELPKEFKGTIYFYLWHKHNLLMICQHKSRDPEYVYLGKKDIEIEFSVSKDDAVKQIVEYLQAEKKEIQAKAQSDLNKLDEKINSLLAINYDDGE